MESSLAEPSIPLSSLWDACAGDVRQVAADSQARVSRWRRYATRLSFLMMLKMKSAATRQMHISVPHTM